MRIKRDGMRIRIEDNDGQALENATVQAMLLYEILQELKEIKSTLKDIDGQMPVTNN